MKKLLIGTILFVGTIVAFGFRYYQNNYTGTSYYVQITTEGEQNEVKLQNGSSDYDYKYTLNGYDTKGNQKELTFMTILGGKQLRKGAYLDVTVNRNKGVTSWREVQKEDIPEKALAKLG